MKLVSIIIPVYNAESYLRECLDSICEQDYEDIEIICVNDGSIDNSADIIKTEYPNVLLIEKKHSNAGETRNIGIANATGDYLMFLDADDWFEKNYVSSMVKKAEDTNADIVICGSVAFDNITKKKKKLIGSLNITNEKGDSFVPTDYANRLFEITAGWPWDKLFKKELILKNNLFFQCIQIVNDVCFVNVAMASAERIAFVKEVMITHRTNVKTSIEGSCFPYWRCGFEMFEYEWSQLVQREISERYRETFINQISNYIMWNLRNICMSDYWYDYYSYLKSYLEEKDFFSIPVSIFHHIEPYSEINMVKDLDACQYLVYRIKEQKNCYDLYENTYLELCRVSNEFYDYTETVKNIEAKNKIVYEKEKLKRWMIPYTFLETNRKFIIYGNGKIGKSFVEQIMHSKGVNLVAVVDKDIPKNTGYPVISIDDIDNFIYDVIIIAILNIEEAEKVRKNLVDKGIDSEKIFLLRQIL